jgi:adenine-specific DNA-methyltransferase
MEYFNLSDTLEKRNKRDEINLLIRNIVNYDKVKQKETKWKNIQLMRSQMGLFNDKQNEQQLSFSDLNSKEINKELAEYTELERISNTEHFEWHLNFNDVFENGGFDILIANPPYIKEYVNKDAFNGLRNSPYYQGKMDLWYFFICRGSELIKENTGIITFIAQNNWTTSFGASKMRNKIIKDTQIINLIDFNNYKVFEAGIQTMVMMFKKYTELDIYVFDYRRLMGEESELKDLIKVLSKNESKNIEYLTPLINRDQLVNKKLTFSNSKIELILDKLIAKNNFNLDSNEEVAQGIVYPQDRINKASLEILGKNYKLGDGIFVLSAYEKKNLNFTEKELQLIKPVYTTKELFKWYGKKDNSDWAIYTDSRFKNLKSIYEFPNIKKHLDQFNKVITSDNKPYGLHRARDEKFFVGEKIIAVRKCSMPTFTYVDFDSYVSATFYIIKTKRINQKYLVAILNSKIIAFWLKHKGKMQGGNYQIDKEPIIELPIFIASNEDQRILIKLVDEIIKIYKDVNKSDEALKTIQLHENEINRVVYKLYDLKDEDKQEIEDDLKR